MSKFGNGIKLALFLMLPTASLHAQRGCFHSPEAPTGVLMMVGSAGMFYGSNFVMKLVRRRRKS